jgi:hypothetical protein
VRIAAALLLVLATACHLPREPRPLPNEGAWAVARDRMTRTGKIYDGLATNAFVQVVYLPREVRDALVARIAEWKALTAEETQKLLVAERDDAARYEEFIVSMFTPDPADNDLDTAKSIWRVALVIDGSDDVLPESMHLERVDAMSRALYPMIGDFDAVYRVRFPRTHALDGRAFTLRLAGARGRIDFEYGASR